MALFNFRKNEEKPTEIRNDAEIDFQGILNGTKKVVNDISSIKDMSLSAVFAAIERISNAVAELPINVKTKNEDKDVIVKNHYIYDLMKNTRQTKYMFIKMLVCDMLMYGDGIAYIVRGYNKKPIKLIYIPHSNISISKDGMTDEVKYSFHGTINKSNVKDEDVIHLFKNSNDGVTGISVLSYANTSITLAKYIEKACNNYFSKNQRHTGILSLKERLFDNKQLYDLRDSLVFGADEKSNGIVITDGDMTFTPINDSSKDSQLLESRLFNLQEIARFFNINPVLLGDLSHSSYSTIEASLLEFVTNTISPYITIIEEEFNKKLVIEKDIYVDLDENFLIKSDKQTQANYVNTLKGGGIMTINEVRSILGLNPIEGGDVLMVNYTNIDDNIINKDKNKEKKEDEEQRDEA